MTTTSETLYLAADLLETRGWKRFGGWPVDDSHPLCLEGGIMAAQGQTWGEVDPAELWDCPAFRAVQSYLGLSHEKALLVNHVVPSPVDPLWRWNDRYTASDGYRTASEVIEVLRAAAVIEAARENETAAVERVAS